MSYSDLFNTLTVEVLTSRRVNDEDGEPILDENGKMMYDDVYKTYDVKNLHLVYSDSYLLSLAILTDIEDKTAHPNPKNTGFLRAYRQAHGGVSLESIARRIVALYDTTKGEAFAPEMFHSHKRWGRGRMGKKDGKRAFISDTFDENCGYDPFVLSSREKSTDLSHAGLTLLAKGLRFFLEETLRHFYQKSDPNSWYPYTDKKGKRVLPDCAYNGTMTSASFASAVSELLELFNGVYSWSPHLDEFSEATAKAVEAGRADRDAKFAKRVAETAGNRSYGVSDGKPRQREASSGDRKQEARPAKKPVVVEVKKPKVVRETTVDDDGWVTTAKVVKAPVAEEAVATA